MIITCTKQAAHEKEQNTNKNISHENSTFGQFQSRWTEMFNRLEKKLKEIQKYSLRFEA